MDNLILLSGNEIPFPECQTAVHQPTIREIAYIGEETFFTGCEILNFSKNLLAEEDKKDLEDKTNFDILIAILREQNAVMQKNRNCVELVLALMFPLYEVWINNDHILCKGNEHEFIINNDNFEGLKSIINSMLAYRKETSSELNPSGEMAKRIANKLKKRHQKLSETKEAKSEGNKIDILGRYISILAVGLQKDINGLFNYTIYQLFDEFKRYELKMSNDIYIQACMAGAQDLKEVEDWMKNIHS